METIKIVTAFETELNLTEEGFIKLTEQKNGLVIDVKTTEGFKLARKERTERNKTIEGVDRLAIDGKTAVDEARNVLKERINKIYAPIVTAFEVEDLRQKEEKKKKAQDEAERIEKIRDQINSIRLFATNLIGQTSEGLQEIIEAVDMIDVSESFAELTQDAMSVKKETLADLNQALASAIQNEQLEVEREKLRKQGLVQQEEKRANKAKAKAQERLNNLIMIPSTMFGKTSDELNKKLNSIDLVEILESEFGELFDQANVAKIQVITQLGQMAEQQALVESAQAQNQGQAEAVTCKNKIYENPLDENHQQEYPVKGTDPEFKGVGRVPAKKQGVATIIPPPELTQHEEMMKQVDFWANEYGVINSAYSDLINILNQYK